jgi:leader peptidase (prepilin peptidase)/N-methyltransferase
MGLWCGAFVGSFLNVVIYRMPRGLGLGKPVYSFCPNCKHRLEIPDLVPLLSWLALRGKCRHCGVKVSSRYFFVELLNGAIWSGIWYQYFVAGWDPVRACVYAAAASALVAIIFIDWELFIIPDQINAFLAVLGIGYNFWLIYSHAPGAMMWGMPSALAGWLTGVGVLWGIAFLGRVAFRKDAMGHGDIKMARGIGCVLFPAVALLSFGLAVVLGAVLGVAQVLIRRGPPNVGTQGDSASESSDEEEEFYPPESIGSLLFCGLGYLLGADIIGLFIPKLYMWWFKEPAFIGAEDWDDAEVEHTMIPFGPYLALGAIVATIFASQLLSGVQAYFDWASGKANRAKPVLLLEHLSYKGGLLEGEGWSMRT